MIQDPVRTVLWRVGTTLAPGEVELIAPLEPGLEPERTVTTAATRIARGATDSPGLVLVDLEPAPGGEAASFVRKLEPPHEIDIARFDAALVAFARAGAPSPIHEPAAVALQSVFAELLGETPESGHIRLPWDPRAYLTTLFLHHANQRDEVFPTMWWHDDPSAGIDEMAGLLKLHGVRGTLSRKRLIAEAIAELDQLDDEDVARDRLCDRLCGLANDLLARTSDRRFCGPYASDDEPSWLLTTPRVFDALIAEQLLVRWQPTMRVPPVVNYVGSPDLGELDLANFPSGDDPF